MSHRADKSFTVHSRTGPVLVVNQGYLRKKSPKSFMGFAQWQERFFVLETDRLLYYKSDRARSMGDAPNGSIAVAEIRAVSIPQDHKDGCRLDLETTSRRVYELQAGSASDCQRWLNLLTTQCRSLGTLADMSDEAAVDAQHEKDLLMIKNAAVGAGADPAQQPGAVLPPEPDFTDDELIFMEPEVTREMDQLSISVSLDLQGANAEKIAPFVVCFGQQIAPTLTPTSSSSSSPAVSSTALTPTAASPSLYANLEVVLMDPGSSAGVLEIASSLRPSLSPLVALYLEIRAFRLCTTAAGQTTHATNIWQRFLRKGAGDLVAFPATGDLVARVHDALKKRAVTLTTFDGMQRHALSVLRRDFWMPYTAKFPHALSAAPTVQPGTGLSFNPAQLHPTGRKITGSTSSGTGVQVTYQRSGSMINGNPLKGWDELARTEVLPRLGKKALTATAASAAQQQAQASESVAPPRNNKSSIFGGSGLGPNAGGSNERRHFDVLLGVNLEVGAVERAGADKRLRKLNGLDLLPRTAFAPLAPPTPSSIAAARARRAEAAHRKTPSGSDLTNSAPTGSPGAPSSPHRRRSSSFDASSAAGGLSKFAVALAKAAQKKALERALDETDASLGRVAHPQLSEGDEDGGQSDDDSDDGASPQSPSPSPDGEQGSSNKAPPIPTRSHIFIDRTLKILRLHIYHSTELNNEDLSSHVLLARVEVSLKEILHAENGELSRALFMVDTGSSGASAGLGGFIHLMFHDRRRLKISSTPRYCYRSYIFRDVGGQDMVCHESLQESPFTFQLPHSALTRAVDHARLLRKQCMQNLSETDASITAGLLGVAEESQKSKLLSHLQRQVKAYTQVIAQWERLVKLYTNYAGQLHGLRFKPSVEKNCRALGFVPINCHVQSFTVTHTGRSRSRPLGLIGNGSALVPAGAAFGPASPARAPAAPVVTSPALGPARPGPPPLTAGATPSTRPQAMTTTGAPGQPGVEAFAPLAPIEASSFLFEHTDFLAELRQAHQRQSAKAALSAAAAASGSGPTPRAFSSANGLGAPKSIRRCVPVAVNVQRSLPKPASAQTKAVAQMIANSHAMAAASYSASLPSHLGGLAASSNAPAFLNMSISGGAPDHRATVGSDSRARGEGQPKLLFTADENQGLTAYAPQGSAQAAAAAATNSAAENNLERARLYRKVPPRSPADRSYACHHYLNTTCGAFAAHNLGFKAAGGGGMMKLIAKLHEGITKHATDVAQVRKEAGFDGIAIAAAVASEPPRLVRALLESGQKVLQHQWENQQRQHTVLAQAMTALATSFVAHLLASLQSVDAWRRISRIGYLQQVESLLSTFHSEQHMLQDMVFAVRALEHVKFTIVPQPRADEGPADPDEVAFGSFDMGAVSEKLSNVAPTPTASPPPPTPLPMIIPPPPPSPPSMPAPPLPQPTTPRADTPSPPPPPPPSNPPAPTRPPPAAPTAGLMASPPPAVMVTVSAPSAIPASTSDAPSLSPTLTSTPSTEALRVAPPVPPRRSTASGSPTAGPSSASPSTLHVSTGSIGGLPSPMLSSLFAAASPSTTTSAASTATPLCNSPLALSPAAVTTRPVAPAHGRTLTLGVPAPGGLGASWPRPQPVLPSSATLPTPVRSPSPPRATGPAACDADFVSAEDNMALIAAGQYPSVQARLSELNAVHLSLLLPATAAPVASLPYATDAPVGTKKARWFSTNGTSSSAADHATSMAGAEAAARAASGVPFSSVPILPHPYTASSVVIVIELPPHLYRLLPACLREVEPRTSQSDRSAANAAPTASPISTTSPTSEDPSVVSNPAFLTPMSPVSPRGSGRAGENSASGSFDETGTGFAAKVADSASPTPILTSSDGEAAQLSTPLVDVWPVLITQGVNELQTMANKVGSSKTELQQQVNLYSLELLKAYFIAYAKYQKAHLDLVAASSKERLRNASVLGMIGKDLQACELMIHSFNSEKNIQLLVLAADIVKKMSGARIVCCKSAKDRTSMAVTWDQARVLYEQHGLSEHDVQSALNLMRTEGVRKLNVVKNTSQSAYAFNVLQRSFLPAIFRPPEHACSSSIEG